MADARFRPFPWHRFRIEGDMLWHNRQSCPIAGATAEVHSSGFLATRRYYLTVSAGGQSWTVRLDSLTIGQGRKFAGQVNAAAAAIPVS